VQEILHQAEQLERNYDWLGAAESYKRALDLLFEDDFSRKADVTERLGYAFCRFAFQAETNEEFRDRLRQSNTAYEKAAEFYEISNVSVKAAKTSRCNAMISYIGYWLATEAKGKKKLIDECRRLTKDALEAFKEANEDWEYGKTHNQLSSSVVFAFCLDWDFQSRQKMIREAVESGEQAIKSLSMFEDHLELARAYARTACYLGVFDHYFLDLGEKQKDSERLHHYWKKAKELSEDIALSEFLYPIFGAQFLLWGDGTEEAFENLNKVMEYGKKARDKFIVGCVFDWLVYHTCIKATPEYHEDPEERSAIDRKIYQYVEAAKQQFASISFISPRDDAFWIEMENTSGYYAALAAYEMDLREKRSLLEKARKALPDGLKRAEASGNPEVTGYANHMFGYVLLESAKIETNSDVKKRHLEEAVKHEKESARITGIVQPFMRWNHGILQSMLASAESHLADLEQDPESRKIMLLGALADRESGLKFCLEEVQVLEKQMPGCYGALGSFQYAVGVTLARLYELTSNEEYLRKAAKVFAEAAESYEKVNFKNRVAECQWKSALAYDALGEHLKAAENFDLASDDYKIVSERGSQIKNFYSEYASYMAAWSEIEKARHHHDKQEYGLAKGYYERAATMHKSLKHWSYLTLNYSAWAQVEEAEDLSRSEKSEEALQSFEQAAKLFAETKKTMETKIGEIGDPDEKKMAAKLVKVSDVRREYCLGRIELEEAKILDKKGDHLASSQKYGSLARTFEGMIQSMESEREKKEFKLIATLAQAWQRMTRAEAEESPHLYLEASQLFEEAKDLSPNEQAKILTLGHSRFCKALEVGTRFVDTRDHALHSIAIQQLESAATYYVKAGFQNASEYAKATEQLFDAYMHVDNAKREIDPEKKAKYYAVAEKILQTSAGSFMKAEHPEKREQVLRLLEKVKEERELATSLCEILHTPPIVSTTTTFNTPDPTHENAVGLEKFEHPDVHANIIVNRNELNVGENLEVEIELANVGRGTALLDRIEGAIPNGFEIVEKLQTYRVESGNVNMKGRRLEQQKGEDVRFSLRPKHKGSFTLKPMILYIDEKGSSKSHEPEPVTITVKELGISGWLKGER
jgi:hypothetical protein